MVTVERNETQSYGASEWTVTFDTEIGDLPMLEATSGRLTGDIEIICIGCGREWIHLVAVFTLYCMPLCHRSYFNTIGRHVHSLVVWKVGLGSPLVVTSTNL